MMETVEEAVVSKEAHVIEEITITKRAKDHVEKIRDKVRKTEVNIEGLGAEKLRDLGSERISTPGSQAVTGTTQIMRRPMN